MEDVLNQAEITYPWLLQEGAKFVAKPDQLIKRRGKSGLLALNKTWAEAKAWVAERATKTVPVEHVEGVLRQFLVEPFVPHPDGTEYYININSVRDVSSLSLYAFADGIPSSPARVVDEQIYGATASAGASMMTCMRLKEVNRSWRAEPRSTMSHMGRKRPESALWRKRKKNEMYLGRFGYVACWWILEANMALVQVWSHGRAEGQNWWEMAGACRGCGPVISSFWRTVHAVASAV